MKKILLFLISAVVFACIITKTPVFANISGLIAKTDLVYVSSFQNDANMHDYVIIDLSDGNFGLCIKEENKLRFNIVDIKTNKIQQIYTYAPRNRDIYYVKFFTFEKDKLALAVSSRDKAPTNKDYYDKLTFDYIKKEMSEGNWEATSKHYFSYEPVDEEQYKYDSLSALNKHFVLTHDSNNVFLIDRKTNTKTCVNIPISGRAAETAGYVFASAMQKLIPMGFDNPSKMPYRSVHNLGDEYFVINHVTGYLLVDPINKKYTPLKFDGVPNPYSIEIYNVPKYSIILLTGINDDKNKIFLYDNGSKKLSGVLNFSYYYNGKKDMRVFYNPVSEKTLMLYQTMEMAPNGSGTYFQKCIIEMLSLN